MKWYNYILKLILYDGHYFLCKEHGEFYYFKCLCDMRPNMPSNMLSFINFEPLKLYWTYFLALQTMTFKIPPMRLMSLDHEPKMRCCAMSSNYGPWWDHIAISFGPWASASFLWIRTLLGFKIDSPKIYDNIDVMQVANEMKPYGVKNLSSTMWNNDLLSQVLSHDLSVHSKLGKMQYYHNELCKTQFCCNGIFQRTC